MENTGAAFGLFKSVMWLVVSCHRGGDSGHYRAAVPLQAAQLFQLHHRALLIAGGIGNLIDRIVHGYVVDYIHALFFDYVFNFADCCITVGAVLFVIHVLFSPAKGKETLPRESERNEPSTPHPRGEAGSAGG